MIDNNGKVKDRMEVWKRSVSGQMKVELRNGTDWMLTVCECGVFSFLLLCVWVCGCVAKGGLWVARAKSIANWTAETSILWARARVAVAVHKDSGGNLRSNAFLSWLVWRDIPGAQLAARVWPRWSCHVILMPFSFHRWDLSCSVVCVCVSPVCTARQARNMSMWQSKPEESRSSCVTTNGMNYYGLINEEMYSRGDAGRSP